jgi:drug/metabolite transporter (DMT)-like permease
MFSNKHNQAILALIIANIIWGAASPIFKLALQNITPFTLAFFRFFGASLLLLPFAYHNLFIKREDIKNLILLSFFGITINITFFFFGLKLAPSINAPVIGSTGPIFCYIASILFLREKPKLKTFLGIIISLTGILAIVLQPILTEGIDGQILGNLFFILAMLGAVGHSIFSKKIMKDYPAITITFWSFVIGTFTFLPMLIYETIQSNPLSLLDTRGYFGLMFGIFLSSAVGYFLFEWGLKQISSQEVGIFTYIDPLAATIIAIPLLGEYITPIFIIGSLFVFTGIYISEGRIHYHPFHKFQK